MPTTTITTASGRTRELPGHVDPADVLGLDQDGRIVVQQDWMHGGADPFAFGLTLCCDAWDKGVEDGVVCRSCFSYAESGNYLFEAHGYPGLDPVAR